LIQTAGREIGARVFESVWVAEHVVLFDDYDSNYPYSPDGRFPGGGDAGLLEPFVALTFLAAVTEHIRLGTGICLVPQRNPVYTAKQVVDLDALSRGRVDFGVGAGWLREERGREPGGRAAAQAGPEFQGPVERRRLRVPGRALRAPELSDVPEAGPATSPAHPRRR
jgi:alkanesulfonate monooxygenase SsuD/methylene tetrahydromethanopterin reductase-like flavin-dependent oxidoreductase (luciferase family)